MAEASVVLCYLTAVAAEDLKSKFESELKPGSRVVMEMFSVPGWKPARTARMDYRDFYLYIMPPERTET